MQYIREYLELWHPEWYDNTFSDKETLECFQEVMGASLDELDPYIINSKRWKREFEEAIETYDFLNDLGAFD